MTSLFTSAGAVCGAAFTGSSRFLSAARFRRSVPGSRYAILAPGVVAVVAPGVLLFSVALPGSGWASYLVA